MSDNPQQEMTVGEVLQKGIKDSDWMVKECIAVEKRTAPPVVQEIVLARRHLEDANNRFKKAYNLLPEDLK